MLNQAQWHYINLLVKIKLLKTNVRSSFDHRSIKYSSKFRKIHRKTPVPESFFKRKLQA